MNNSISVTTFLNTLKAEVKATKDARQSITSDAVQSEQQYHDAVQTAHIVVGARVPSRMQTMYTNNATRSKTVGATRTFGTTVTEMDPKTTPSTAPSTIKKEDFHVYFDPEQDIDTLMAYKSKQHH